MKVCKLTRMCCAAVLLAGLLLVDRAISADEATRQAAGKELKEMPVLTGQGWQSLQPDSKIAFIWGIGHVVTVEEHVVRRYPEMQRQDFVSKLADGLRGVPMSSIVEQVDGYYRRNPEDMDLPVVRVIWSEIVRPRLKAGVADAPFAQE